MKNNLFGTALIGIFIGLIIVSIICKETEVVNKQDTTAVGSHNKSDTLDVTTDEFELLSVSAIQTPWTVVNRLSTLPGSGQNYG